VRRVAPIASDLPTAVCLYYLFKIWTLNRSGSSPSMLCVVAGDWLGVNWGLFVCLSSLWPQQPFISWCRCKVLVETMQRWSLSLFTLKSSDVDAGHRYLLSFWSTDMWYTYNDIVKLCFPTQRSVDMFCRTVVMNSDYLLNNINPLNTKRNLLYVQSCTVYEILAGEVWNFDSCYTLTDYQIHIETGRSMWFL
jgi:hypothetical protein